jgi:hypothetical protein
MIEAETWPSFSKFVQDFKQAMGSPRRGGGGAEAEDAEQT